MADTVTNSRARGRSESASAPSLAEQGSVPVLRAASFARIEWLRHGFSTRTGGASTIYGGHTLNLGWTPHDDPELVHTNRLRFSYAVAAEALPLLGVRQVHSAIVRIVVRTGDGVFREESSGSALVGENNRPALEGDGLMTDVPNVLLAAGVADCVPVLVADVRRKAVAAFHAGWRGTAARIVEHGIRRMRERYGSRPDDLVAAIGPSIGACCYVVGEDLRTAFAAQFAYADQLFPEHSHLNLWEANRRQLLDAGLAATAITVVGECTACMRVDGDRKYFSHRGESGFAGRGLGVIGLVG